MLDTIEFCRIGQEVWSYVLTDCRAESYTSLIETDAAFQEQDKKGVNPEQLFAMGYAACFDSALNMTAQHMKLPITASKTSTQVGIGMKADGSYNLDIDLYVEVSGIDEVQAQTLVEAAHQVCPYSNATRGNVDARLQVTVV